MNCRDVREVADSFLCEELLTETNHDILRHLDTCPSCRTEIDARRRLRGALRTAFNRAPELQPAGAFADRLRDQLRHEKAWELPGGLTGPEKDAIDRVALGVGTPASAGYLAGGPSGPERAPGARRSVAAR